MQRQQHPLQHPLSINDLPSAVLARIFTLTHPRRDGLALLLTCRHWLGVAEAECAQHLWGSLVVHSDGEQLLGQQAQAALLAGLRRRAAGLAELCIVPRRACLYPDGATAVRLSPLWPKLLGAVEQALHLNALRFHAAQFPLDCAGFCEALGSLTSLQQLVFKVRVPHSRLPPPTLHHLSTLTRLEQLDLRLDGSVGELPAKLLPALGSLTSLQLYLTFRQRVSWQLPDGTGPSLRQLHLGYCQIGLQADRLLNALRPLERLELFHVDMREAQFSTLPQLPHLTSLAVKGAGAPWPAVLHCAGLRELAVVGCAHPAPAHLPRGSLQQLTRLALDCAHASPDWLALPQLRSLELSSRGEPLPPMLGQCVQLEELVVWGIPILEVTQAVASFTQLTRLEIRNYYFAHQEPLVLHEGPYLAVLRELIYGSLLTGGQQPTQFLPATLAAATSLELLDLGDDPCLKLPGAEDAALLRALPRLQRVRLPCREGDEAAAAAVARIRDGLRQGAGAGAGSSHAVEVEGVLHR